MTQVDWAQVTRSSVRRSWRPVLVVVLGVLVAAAVLVLIARHFDVPTADLASDPNEIAGAPVWFGLTALVDFAVWSAGAGAALVGGLQARQRPDPQRLGRFLLQASALTAYLVVDDMFLFHENLYPNVLGIPQKLVMVVYVVLVVAWLVLNRGAIAGTDFPILLLGGLFFAMSVVMDQGLLLGFHPGPFTEDVPKVIGIFLWSVYLVRTAVGVTRPLPDSA